MKQVGDRTTLEIFGEVPAPPPAGPKLPIVNYRQLGDDYRERERVARKVRRWAGKFSSLTRLEQAEIFAHLEAIAMPDDVQGNPYRRRVFFIKLRAALPHLDSTTAAVVLDVFLGKGG